jgi:hypothetical protein
VSLALTYCHVVDKLSSIARTVGFFFNSGNCVWVCSLFYAKELHVTDLNGLLMAATCCHAVDESLLLASKVLKPYSGLCGWKFVFHHRSLSLVCDSPHGIFDGALDQAIICVLPFLPVSHHFTYAHPSFCMVCNICDHSVRIFSDPSWSFTSELAIVCTVRSLAYHLKLLIIKYMKNVQIYCSYNHI